MSTSFNYKTKPFELINHLLFAHMKAIAKIKKTNI